MKGKYQVCYQGQPVRFYPKSKRKKGWNVNSGWPSRFDTVSAARVKMHQCQLRGKDFSVVFVPAKAFPARLPMACRNTKPRRRGEDRAASYGKYIDWMTCADCGGKVNTSGPSY